MCIYHRWKHNLTLRLAVKYLKVESKMEFRLSIESVMLLEEWERERVDGRRRDLGNKFVAYRVKLSSSLHKKSREASYGRFDAGLIGPLLMLNESCLETKQGDDDSCKCYLLLPASNASSEKAFIWTNASGASMENVAASAIRLCGKVLHLSKVSAKAIEVNIKGSESEEFMAAVRAMNPLLPDVLSIR